MPLLIEQNAMLRSLSLVRTPYSIPVLRGLPWNAISHSRVVRLQNIRASSSIMPTLTFGPGDLLEYNAKHRLLICRQCQYAVQKSALESHLLRHKIYRADRQRLLSSIAQLELLEPDHVLLPAAGSPPVDALPILSGYCCTAERCRHLTASSKRMKRHWSGTHGLDGSVPLSSSFARPVKLQTFFRGTKIRYFEVASPMGAQINSDDDGDDGDDGHGEGDDEGCEPEGHNAITVAPSSPPPPAGGPAPPETAQGPSSADFNLETLTYFHYFNTATSLTLPGSEDPQSTIYHWQTHIVLQALRRRWLICGLLAISAHHLATLADDTTTKRTHRDRGMQFSSEFSAGLRQTTESHLDIEAAEMENEAQQTGEQISRLLRCVEWPLAEPSFDHNLMAPCPLLSVMSIIQGCVVSESTRRRNGPQNLDHGDQEEFSVQGLVHTTDPSHSATAPTNPPSENVPSAVLTLLHDLPFRIADGLGRSTNPQDVFATLSAISTAVQCCTISFARDDSTTAWHGVATWLANIPKHFTHMVARYHPAALVVLAHWAAVLLKRAERTGCWFLQGSAKIIVLQVARQLSASSGYLVVLGLVERLVSLVED